jgi:predicted  nucleic acid-binding Zn-ribbon protein
LESIDQERIKIDSKIDKIEKTIEDIENSLMAVVDLEEKKLLLAKVNLLLAEKSKLRDKENLLLAEKSMLQDKENLLLSIRLEKERKGEGAPAGLPLNFEN